MSPVLNFQNEISASNFCTEEGLFLPNITAGLDDVYIHRF